MIRNPEMSTFYNSLPVKQKTVHDNFPWCFKILPLLNVYRNKIHFSPKHRMIWTFECLSWFCIYSPEFEWLLKDIMWIEAQDVDKTHQMNRPSVSKTHRHFNGFEMNYYFAYSSHTFRLTGWIVETHGFFTYIYLGLS